MADEEFFQCPVTKCFRLPYDSTPETITLRCVLEETHDGEHEFGVSYAELP